MSDMMSQRPSDPSTSVNVFARPADGWSVGLGLYDAEKDGLTSGRKGPTPDLDAVFAIGQVDRFWRDLGGLGEGRLVLGGWVHTGDVEELDGRGGGGDTGGGYAILEQRLTPGQVGGIWRRGCGKRLRLLDEAVQGLGGRGARHGAGGLADHLAPIRAAAHERHLMHDQV